MSSHVDWNFVLKDIITEVNESIGKEAYNDLRKKQIVDLRSYRSAFECLCRDKREYNSLHRVQSRLMPSYDAVLDLARAIDKSSEGLQKRSSHDRLESLVWMVSFALIQRAYELTSRIVNSTAVADGLNRTVPQFSKQKIEFPDVVDVQRPLQTVYTKYIRSHLQVITILKTTTPTHDQNLLKLEAIETLMTTNDQEFQSARGEYHQAVNHAAQDRAREETAKQQPDFQALAARPSRIHPESKEDCKITISFTSMRILERGSFGEVDEVQEESTKCLYARKHIHTRRPGGDISDTEVMKEISSMQRLHHRHIAAVQFYIKKPEEKSYSIFMLPVADCNLREYLKNCSTSDNIFDTSMTGQIVPTFGCLLDALSHAHRQKVYHRDIKPTNILICNNQPYLTDFGLAKSVSEIDDSTFYDENGTMAYRPPEHQRGNKHNSATDVFSLGCTYSEMLTVVEERSLSEYTEYRQCRQSFRESLPEMNEWLKIPRTESSNKVTKRLVAEITKMIAKRPEDRPLASTSRDNLKSENAFWCVEDK